MNTPNCEQAAERQFDSFCKKVLRNEAAGHIREVQRIRRYEVPLDELPAEDTARLVSWDSYPSECFVFTFLGYELPIHSDAVADAFASLKTIDQSILILDLVLGLSNRKIGKIIGLSRSSVQRRKADALQRLRELLEQPTKGEK